jgi:thiamine biosynthesis lipoprotein
MAKRTGITLIFAALLLLLCGCSGGESQKSTDEFFAMDTVMDLTAYGKNGAAGITAAETEINRLDALLSVGNADSEIARLDAGQTTTVSEETAALLKRALAVSKMTDGAYDCTVYPLVSAWGFFSGDYRVPEASEIETLLQNVGWEKVSVDGTAVSMPAGTQLDLGGIGKGYASAQAKKVLQDAGVTSAIVSLGGNISALGHKPDGSNWTVAIQDPADTSTYFGLLETADKCVITSGGYQRYFEQDGKTYWHILDPETGYPADSGILSATVVSSDDVLSDGLSTALFVMGLGKAEALWRENSDLFDMILMTSDRKVYITSGISDDFTTELDCEVVRP